MNNIHGLHVLERQKRKAPHHRIRTQENEGSDGAHGAMQGSQGRLAIKKVLLDIEDFSTQAGRSWLRAIRSQRWWISNEKETLVSPLCVFPFFLLFFPFSLLFCFPNLFFLFFLLFFLFFPSFFTSFFPSNFSFFFPLFSPF